VKLHRPLVFHIHAPLNHEPVEQVIVGTHRVPLYQAASALLPHFYNVFTFEKRHRNTPPSFFDGV
jgi:hypothetical protein